MTDERKQPHRDPLVARHYRDIAVEESPERVDKRILARASSIAKPRYARLRMWSRPLGWAMTIALSIALVLQLTRPPEAPVSPDVFGPGPAADAPSRADELVPLDSRLLEEAEDMVRMQSGPQRQPETASAPTAIGSEQETEEIYCDAEARSTRSSWLDCIDQLETEGRIAEAEIERRAFEHAFPSE